MTLLLDIEGTTTPIDFVHKVLFPYARRHIGAFVGEHLAELGPEVIASKKEAEADIEAGKYENGFDPGSPGSVAAYLEFLIDNDRKSTPLKSIQGMVWKHGYESGELVSQVFEDVPRAFERWSAEGTSVNIYSSGSALAQVLLFRHSDQGDLTEFIDNYFDTHIGHKREQASYAAIASRLLCEPPDIVFVSDVDAELDAARAAGMETRLSVRDGNPPQANEGGHPVIRSLDELF